MNQVFWYTYVLYSQKDKNHYIGFTSDLKLRLQKHNDGEVYSTRYRRPLELVYFEACKTKELAIKREKYFKTGFGRRFLSGRI